MGLLDRAVRGIACLAVIGFCAGCTDGHSASQIPADSSIEASRPTIDPAAPLDVSISPVTVETPGKSPDGVGLPWTLTGLSHTRVVITYGSSLCHPERIVVDETDSYISVGVQSGNPRAAGCADVAKLKTVSFNLKQPLGERRLLHAATQ